MQPQLCSRCKKNVAVVFITRMENGKNINEGLCLKCAKNLGLPQVNEMMQRMGITDEDLDNISNEMMSAFGGAENLEGIDAPDGDDEEDGKTATFPFLGRLFGGQNGDAPAPADGAADGPGRAERGKKNDKAAKHKFLDSYCINLSQRARDGKLDAVIGRDEEIERVVQILNRRQKNNPCLIGEPGVGKTAIAEGLAQRIAAGEVPFKLRSKEVYLLDLTALVAGTQFRGQFESRMKGLIEEIRKLGNIILVIDEVHNIVGAGDAEGSMNAANILKPALSRGEIQVIGATTFNEYRKHIEKDTALERRFQPVTVNEPSMEDTRQDSQGHRPLLRVVPRRENSRRHPAPGRRAFRALHHRPLPAGQGHRPDRRGVLGYEPARQEHQPPHGAAPRAGRLRQGARAARGGDREPRLRASG